MKKITLLSLSSLFISLSSTSAENVELPKTIAWTTYSISASSYNEAVAIGAELKNEYGVNLRLLPGKNDISRLLPLMRGRVQFSATAESGAYMAQEGVFEYAQDKWGPQPLRLVTSNNSGLTNLAAGVSVSSGVKSYDQLRGKRIPYIEGGPGLNVGMEGFLAYGGLTWDDVEIVKYGGYDSGWKGLMAGEIDAMISITNSGFAYEAASGPHGLFWPEVDPNNKEAFARISELLPYVQPNIATVGANVDANIGYKGVTYKMPVLVTPDSTDEKIAYGMLKAMDELYPKYENKTKAIMGWKLEKQDLVNNLIPYHEGAIKYFKEKGLWTEEAQKNQDKLIARQEVLQNAWKELKQENPSDLKKAWLDARINALTAAGFEATFSKNKLVE